MCRLMITLARIAKEPARYGFEPASSPVLPSTSGRAAPTGALRFRPPRLFRGRMEYVNPMRPMELRFTQIICAAIVTVGRLRSIRSTILPHTAHLFRGTCTP